MFIVEGFGTDQNKVENLPENSAWLQSKNDKVYLIPQNTYIGEMQISQTILKPEHPLKVGETYKIYMPTVRSGALEGYTDSGLKEYQWMISKSEDLTPPVPTKDPFFISKDYTAYGCGPAVTVNIGIVYTDQNPVFAEVTVGPDKRSNKKKKTYIVPVEGNQIVIGHGMCSGAFNLEPGKKYTANIQLLDISGNRSATNIPPISFIAPSLQ